MDKNIFHANVTWKEATKIVREGKGWRQEDLANFIGLDDSTISKMGKLWELHWKCFLKLLPYFMEYDVDLNVTADNGNSDGEHTNQCKAGESQENKPKNRGPDSPIMLTRKEIPKSFQWFTLSAKKSLQVIH